MDGRVLVLVRHAKAVPDAATDEARPLSGRGRRDAEAAGRWLAELGIVADRVAVSPAVRARQTWDRISAALTAGDVRVDARIYDNTVADLLAVLGESPGAAGTVAVVGHNPSMHGLAAVLDDGAGEPAARAALAAGYPTCGIAVFDVAVAWRDLAPGSGSLRAFSAPRG